MEMGIKIGCVSILQRTVDLCDELRERESDVQCPIPAGKMMVKWTEEDVRLLQVCCGSFSLLFHALCSSFSRAIHERYHHWADDVCSE